MNGWNTWRRTTHKASSGNKSLTRVGSGDGFVRHGNMKLRVINGNTNTIKNNGGIS